MDITISSTIYEVDLIQFTVLGTEHRALNDMTLQQMHSASSATNTEVFEQKNKHVKKAIIILIILLCTILQPPLTCRHMVVTVVSLACKRP